LLACKRMVPNESSRTQKLPEFLAPTLIGWKLNTVCERDLSTHQRRATAPGTFEVVALSTSPNEREGSVAQLVRAPS
jgi:hypothetical protein